MTGNVWYKWVYLNFSAPLMIDDDELFHAYSGRAEKDRFLIRSRARTREIQRRSRMNETLDRDRRLLEDLRAKAEAEYTKDSGRKLRRAEETIVQLLRNSAAFQKTIDRLTDAWGERKEEALESAQAMLDEATRELENDGTFVAKSKAWTRGRLDPDNTRPVAPPEVKPKSRRTPKP